MLVTEQMNKCSEIRISLASVKVNNNIKESGGIYMCNKDIREYAQKHNVKLWQIASALHINDGNFSRKLRVELTEDKKQEIRNIIDELANE